MPTSAPMRAVVWADGVQVAAQDLRLGQMGALLSGLGGGSSPLQVGSGVRDGGGNPLQVSAVSGLSVMVNTGFAVVQGSAAANAGAYGCVLDSAATLTCQAADLVNPRIDSVIVQVVDNGNSTSNATVNIQTGTPASSPNPPAVPANSIVLCNITVPANASSLVSGNLSDRRTYLAAAGAIKPVQGSAFYPTTGSTAAYAHDISTGRLKRFNGTTLVAPSTAAFAPVMATVTSNVNMPAGSPGTLITVASASITCDGYTTIKITCKRAGIYMATPTAGSSLANEVTIDGTQIDGWLDCWPSGIPANVSCMPVTMVAWATPAAGTHTVAWQAQTNPSGQFIGIQAGSSLPAYLRVEAVSS